MSRLQGRERQHVDPIFLPSVGKPRLADNNAKGGRRIMLELGGNPDNSRGKFGIITPMSAIKHLEKRRLLQGRRPSVHRPRNARSTLHREFRKAVGRSPGDYIIDMRIARARTLLGRKGSTLGTVAAKTGFCRASHLSRTLSAKKE